MLEAIKDVYLKYNAPIFKNPYALVILAGFLIRIIYTDVKYRKIENKTLIWLVVSRFILIMPGIRAYPLYLDHIIGAVLMFLCFFIVCYIEKTPAGGDIKLAGALGLYFGGLGSALLHLTAYLFMFTYFIITNGWGAFHASLYTRRFVERDDVKKVPYGAFVGISFVVLTIIHNIF